MRYIDNFATLIRKGVLIRLARAFDSGNFMEDLNRIPVAMRPKNAGGLSCCTYKDRAVIKYRCMAAMGFSVEDEEDEIAPLSDYAKRALSRQTIEGPGLTIIDIACTACIQSRYEITSACRRCISRSCMSVCPRTAISMIDERAKIDSKKCANCGMCLEVCPYHAIARIPIPCEEACPVGAIGKQEDGTILIDFQKCIYCGKCVQACPFGAVMEKSQIFDVLKALKEEGTKLTAMVAPAVMGQFSATMGQLTEALLQLGFDEVVEVALGADKTAVEESQEFIERMEKKEKFMTTSCCPAYVMTVEKHIPAIKQYVSATPSPMHYVAEMIKDENPERVTVFIGPCIAKRMEALHDRYTDYVLTFEELDALFSAMEILPELCEEGDLKRRARSEGRGFPVSGGVTAAISKVVGDDMAIKPLLVDGLTRKTVKLLEIYATRKCPGNFIEVMACEGGCINGPRIVTDPAKSRKEVQRFAEESPAKN